MDHATQAICLTIVTESVLEARLVEDLRRAGASGWTITAAWGRGPRGMRASEIEGGNIRVETLVSPDVADRIWAELAADYFDDYALTAWSYPVQVARADRYLG